VAVTASLSHIKAVFLFAEEPHSVSQDLYFLCGRYCKDSVLRGTNQIMAFTLLTTGWENQIDKSCTYFSVGGARARKMLFAKLDYELLFFSRICAYRPACTLNKCTCVCACVAVVAK